MSIEMYEGKPPNSDGSYRRALFLIATNGNPQIQNPEGLSGTCLAFIKSCLDTDPMTRSSSSEALAVCVVYCRH